MKISGLIVFGVLSLTGCFGISDRITSNNAAPLSPVVSPAATTASTPEDPKTQNSPLVPILETNIGGLLGGVSGGRWVSAKETAAALKGGEKYKVFGVGGVPENDLTGEAPVAGTPCEEFFHVAVKPEGEMSAVALGSNLTWNAVPRGVSKIENSSPVYEKIIGETLSSKNLSKSVPKAAQIFQTDLDGDGKMEVVISAASFKKGLSGRGELGDYSFVLLRTVVNEKAENSVVSGDFVEKAENADAPAEYKISAIADLNGDGKMEIVVFARYYEGDWIEVYEMKDGKAAKVEQLSVACGV